jgi:uncharacterized membrane protein required for colicin V production
MVLQIIKQMNWLDFLVIILLFRMSYASTKSGFFVALFNLLGAVLACYIALHYYARLGDFCGTYIPTPPNVPLEIWDLIAFSALGMLGYAVLIILREAFSRFIKAEAVSLLNKWGASILGVARGLLLISLMIFFLSIPVIDYFTDSVKKSFFSKDLIKVSTSTYTFLWSNLVSKFSPQEKFNTAALEVQNEALNQ